MALPLPRVVSDVGPGGAFVTNARGVNALEASNLQNKILQAQARYAPYTTYADAAAKIAYAKSLPYQINAQILSNPMMYLAMQNNPDAVKALVQNLGNSAPKDVLEGLPQPGESNGLNANSGGGILGIILNKLLGGSQAASQGMPTPNAQTQIPGQLPGINTSTNALNQTPSLTQPTPNQIPNPLVPASTGGAMAGLIGKNLAQYYQEPFKPGTTFADQKGNIYSSPTPETRTSIQQSINAAERVEPILKRLAKSAGPFLTLGGEVQKNWQGLTNYLNMPAIFGKPGDLPTKYAQFRNDLLTAPESLLKTYGLKATVEALKRMQEILEPVRGETPEQYSARILQQLEQIKQEQIGIGSKQLSGGFKLTGNDQKSTSSKSAQPEGRIEDIKQIGDKTYHKIGGKWYPYLGT